MRRALEGILSQIELSPLDLEGVTVFVEWTEKYIVCGIGAITCEPPTGSGHTLDCDR